MNKTILLDTNAFYHYANIDIKTVNQHINNNEFREIIYKDEFELAISSLTVYELIYKYVIENNDINSAKKLIEIINNNFKILQDRELPIKLKTLVKFSEKSSKQIKYISKKLVEEKSKIEANYTSILSCLLTCTYTKFIIDESDKIPTKRFGMFFKRYFQIIEEIHRRCFYDAFVEGYKLKNCENIIRNTFSIITAQYITEFSPILIRFIDINNDEDFEKQIKNLDWDNLKTESDTLIKRIKNRKTTNKFIEREIINFNKSNNLNFYNQFEKEFINPNIKRINNSTIGNFLKDYLKNMIMTGNSFLKNDIMDKLIIKNLEEEKNNVLLLSFDAGMNNFLENNMKINKNFEMSVEYIKKIIK